jgi:hypothetical protein
MRHTDKGYWDAIFDRTKSDTGEPEAPETETERTIDVRNTELQQSAQQQQDVRVELLQELRQSFAESFAGLREEIASMVRDMTTQASIPAETGSKLSQKDSQLLTDARATESKREQELERFNSLMAVEDSSKWSADDRAFVSEQALKQLREEQAAAADELPSDPEELRLYTHWRH